LDNKSYLDFNNFADAPHVDTDKKEAAVILVPNYTHVSGEEISDVDSSTDNSTNANSNSPTLRFHSKNTDPNWFKDTVEVQKIANVSIVKNLNQYEDSLNQGDKAMLVR